MKREHFDYHNVSPNGNIDRPVYAELSKKLFNADGMVMELQCRLYVLKNASKIWCKLVKDKFEASGMNEMNSVLRAFQNDDNKVVC